MAQGEATAPAKILQLHGGSAALVDDHSQLAAISTECGLLLLLRQKRARSPMGSAAASDYPQADQQQRRDADQSSKRELLSRGRELRGGVRPGSSERVPGVVSWPDWRRLGL